MNVFAALYETPRFRPVPGMGTVHTLDDDEIDDLPPYRPRVQQGKRQIDQVLDLIRREPTHSRQIMERLRMQRSAASSYLSLLCTQGYIRRGGRVRGPCGHSLIVYEAVQANGVPINRQVKGRPPSSRDPSKMRGIDAVLAQVREGETYIQEISRATGLAHTAVGSYLTLLVRQGYIEKVGETTSGVVRQRVAAVYAAVVPGPSEPPSSSPRAGRSQA